MYSFNGVQKERGEWNLKAVLILRGLDTNSLEVWKHFLKKEVSLWGVFLNQRVKTQTINKWRTKSRRPERNLTSPSTRGKSVLNISSSTHLLWHLGCGYNAHPASATHKFIEPWRCSSCRPKGRLNKKGKRNWNIRITSQSFTQYSMELRALKTQQMYAEKDSVLQCFPNAGVGLQPGFFFYHVCIWPGFGMAPSATAICSLLSLSLMSQVFLCSNEKVIEQRRVWFPLARKDSLGWNL